MTIYEIVEELKTKYRSSDPFELCDYLGVKVAVTYLGSLKGLYTFIDDVPVILISSAIKRIPQLLVCAHELGHHVLHSDIAKQGALREFTFFNMRDKTEAEANRFMANLNIEDDELDELFREGRSVSEAAQILCFPEELLNIKISDMVRRGKHYITEGDIFQVVVSRRFETEYKSSLVNAYRVLRANNPSPYMYYICDDEIEIAGASPETMVKVIDKKITTFPVAGTRKRGATQTEDERLEKELLADEKELAEHNMLVDLARNDVGKISDYGTVNVDEYMKIHRFSKVMHIASVVTGNLKETNDAPDAVKSLLPAGTLSGAPKYRAMEIIDELEKAPRGIYGGAIGYLDLSGNLDVCIAIRTAIKHKGKVYVQAGAGIVADSIEANEYEECYNKALAVMEAVKGAANVR